MCWVLGSVLKHFAQCANEFGACTKQTKKEKREKESWMFHYHYCHCHYHYHCSIFITFDVCSLLNNVRQRLNYQLSIHCFLPHPNTHKHEYSHQCDVHNIPQMCNKFFLSQFPLLIKRNCYNFFSLHITQWLRVCSRVSILVPLFLSQSSRISILFYSIIALFWAGMGEKIVKFLE